MNYPVQLLDYESPVDYRRSWEKKRSELEFRNLQGALHLVKGA